jgi:hypothetical protein
MSLDERDFFYLLRCGPWGVKWLLLDDVIDEKTNPLMFTCAKCRETAVGMQESFHKKGCKVALMQALHM